MLHEELHLGSHLSHLCEVSMSDSLSDLCGVIGHSIPVVGVDVRAQPKASKELLHSDQLGVKLHGVLAKERSFRGQNHLHEFRSLGVIHFHNGGGTHVSSMGSDYGWSQRMRGTAGQC